jgi:hypothetical protein
MGSRDPLELLLLHFSKCWWLSLKQQPWWSNKVWDGKN